MANLQFNDCSLGRNRSARSIALAIPENQIEHENTDQKKKKRA